MSSLLAVIHTLLLLFNIKYTTSQTCEFRVGGVSYLSGTLQTVGESISAGYKMAIHDYTESQLYNMKHLTSNIQTLSANIAEECTISMDIRDIKTDIKVGIVEIFGLSSSYDQCAMNSNDGNNNETCTINIPFVVGPATSGDSLTTNPLVEAFNLLQFSPSATSTFLSSYSSFYRPIPSDDTQAKALIDLCNYFGWNKLGILYINTDYGTSLQRALTSYANSANIKTTTFSYITEDNVTLSDAVESMHDSNIFIFILIVYDGDAGLLSHLLQNVYHMIEYPYYYIGVDAWLYNNQFTWPEYLPIYGGMIGSCPWSPSIDDPLYELYPYPLNISLKMYNEFYNEWQLLQTQLKQYDITFNISSPGIFTIYAYDVMLTIIKIIDEYIHKFNISNMDMFYNRLYNESTTTIDEFKNILDEIWFIGLSGNVSYKSGGDRYGGLFSFCNVHPETGIIKQFGFSFGEQIIVNEEDIVWPTHSYSKHNVPETEYRSFNGICTKNGSALPIVLWFFIFVSIFLVFIYFGLLFYYRQRKIIRASQWQLSLCMGGGCVVCYITLILFGVDESFPTQNKLNYNWSVLCNFRIFLLNLSFSLIFLPLFTKIYRIKKIFSHAMVQLKKYHLPHKKLFMYNAIFIGCDCILCIILISVIPYNRVYRDGEIINFAITQWGSCSSEPYSYVYFIVLGLPKLIFSLYCIILSISVYSTVSMMKFNEGLQVLICMVISVLLIFVTVGISSIITVNNSTSSIFFYSFISFILLLICNFCCAVMILPRLFSIWKGLNDEEYVNKNDEDKAVKKYMKTLRSNLNKLNNKFNSTLSVNMSVTNKESTDLNNVNSLPNSPNGSTLDLTNTNTNTNNVSSRDEENDLNEDNDQTQKEIMLKQTNQ